MIRFLVSCSVATLMVLPVCVAAEPSAQKPAWTSPNSCRVLLNVDSRGRRRSNSPASVELDFQAFLPGDQKFDEQTVEVVAFDESGRAKVFDSARQDRDLLLVLTG